MSPDNLCLYTAIDILLLVSIYIINTHALNKVFCFFGPYTDVVMYYVLQ